VSLQDEPSWFQSKPPWLQEHTSFRITSGLQGEPPVLQRDHAGLQDGTFELCESKVGLNYASVTHWNFKNELSRVSLHGSKVYLNSHKVSLRAFRLSLHDSRGDLRDSG
jgi:hypothetical protein